MGDCLNTPRKAPQHNNNIQQNKMSRNWEREEPKRKESMVNKSKMKIVQSTSIVKPIYQIPPSLPPAPPQSKIHRLATSMNQKLGLSGTNTPRANQQASIAQIRNTMNNMTNKSIHSSKHEYQQKIVYSNNTVNSNDKTKRTIREEEMKLYFILKESMKNRIQIIRIIQECIFKANQLVGIIGRRFLYEKDYSKKIQMKQISEELTNYAEKESRKVSDLHQKNKDTDLWALDIERDVQNTSYQDSKRCIGTVEVWIRQIQGWKGSYLEDLFKIDKKIEEYSR